MSKKNKNSFNHNPYTIGIEEEYMICNPETGNLINKANYIMRNLTKDTQDRFSYELIQSEIESNTSICLTVNQSIQEVLKLRNFLRELGKKNNYRLGISGTHPTALPIEQKFVDNDAYNWVKDNLGYKHHWALADYLQRSARHVASKVDVDCAYNIGVQAVERALSGKTGVMLTLNRFKSKSNKQAKWVIGEVALNKVCNVEINLPENYIDSTGFGITQECRDYLEPLIKGEAYPPYKDGLPEYGYFLYSEQGSEVVADS